MEGVEFENSLLVLTHASLMKRKIPETEPVTPPSSQRDGDTTPPLVEDDSTPRSKRRKQRKAKASVSVEQTDINVTLSYSPRERSTRGRSIVNHDASSSGSEETSDASPVDSIGPAALVAKLDPNLPLVATLDRNMLLSMSSKDFETFFNHLSTERTLTRSEEKMLKAQRRLISNRESAQASRRRKKAYIEELEGRVLEMSFKMSQVTANNAALSAQTADLLNENATLKNRLDEMTKQATSSPGGPP
ncbi:hypothetical protein PROFUN_00510 [Planoprotostelium fungivorum]|uniref:BZIP domain-containing protein n=1 Tax=Planoprotostelium fungivorum TaxID=1890364 RepID=A0A2P6N127_9EUKA|nr:hypothetical protein PROFUN_00510 [Planoprotostelium fungivorum]